MWFHFPGLSNRIFFPQSPSTSSTSSTHRATHTDPWYTGSTHTHTHTHKHKHKHKPSNHQQSHTHKHKPSNPRYQTIKPTKPPIRNPRRRFETHQSKPIQKKSAPEPPSELSMINPTDPPTDQQIHHFKPTINRSQPTDPNPTRQSTTNNPLQPQPTSTTTQTPDPTTTHNPFKHRSQPPKKKKSATATVTHAKNHNHH